MIKFSRSILGDDPAKTIDQGVNFIEQGAGIVKGVGGVPDGILGGGGFHEPEPDEEDA